MVDNIKDKKDDELKEVPKRRGVVKWYNQKTQHGFLVITDGGTFNKEDVFFHKSAILVTGEKYLPELTEVTFDLMIKENPKFNNGLLGINVKPNNLAKSLDG